MRVRAVLCGFAVCGVLTAVAAEPIVHMLVPGFTVQELPVRISNINNLRFAPDGRLTALGYDGRIHLLSDTDGDGLEDKDELFWEKPTLTVPVGMVWSPEGLYVSSHGKVSLLRDTDGDGKADVEEVIASGWPPTDVGSGGVDATAVTRDEQGNLYFGLLVADYSNAYRIKDGVSHYDTNSPRGTIQKWNKATRGLETIATGIRVPYALAFNRLGDLFLTDQEGETWMPNGNPLDELNHIIPGHNYGFPPRHEKWLPNLISEPPVVAFGPQHESTCGFVFNEASAKQKCFGPEWWEGDAFVAGESRGKIWRVRLVKTSNGYVGKEFLIARLSMLTTDVAISPKGDLYVSCHSGPPDWGTGPQGEGKVFKISYTDPKAPQPVIAWQGGTMEVRAAFDQPLDESITNRVGEMLLEGGEFVSAADRFEVLKPPYEVVKKQEAASRRAIRVQAAILLEEGRVLVLQTDTSLRDVMTYGLTLPGVRAAGSKSAPHTVDMQFDVSGAELMFIADAGLRTIPFVGEKAYELARSSGLKMDGHKVVYLGWLPDPDLAVSKEIARPYDGFDAAHEFASKSVGGYLRLRFSMPAKAATIHATANSPFHLFCLNAADGINYDNLAVKQSNGTYMTRMNLAAYKPSGDSGRLYEVEIQSDPQAALVTLAYSTPDDSSPRPLSLKTFLPGAHVVDVSAPDVPRTDLAGGDYERGRELFFGEQLKCSTCHKIRGEGKEVGPDLTNLIHKDAGSVLRDIREPNATINPDYVGYNIELSNGESLSGFIRAHEEKSIRVLGVDGKETMVDRFNIKELRAGSISLMPSNLLDTIKETQIRDLLTFLLNEAPKRTQAELEAILRVSNSEVRAAKSNVSRPLSMVLVASKQDHGPGQHDYPAWQKQWNEILASAAGVTVTNAWLWPTTDQFQTADLLLFYYWNHDWNAERYRQLDDYLRRGGGIVVLHSATIADKDPEQLAARIGLAAQPSRTRYLHAPLDLRITTTINHPITEGLLDKIHFLDEPYWPMIGDTNKVVVLATAEQEGEVWPMLWTFEKDKGRVFASILGHYTWTLDDPIFRLLILRGLAWAAGEPPGRLERLATKDVSLIEKSGSSRQAGAK